MPRNPSGTYTLPSGNPVEAGTLIEANWANTTLNDIANELTDSLSRSGEGGMLAPFRLADGLQATPGIAWLNEPSTGFYRAGSGEMWGVVSGTQVLQYTANGVLIPASRTFTNNGNTTLGGTLAVTGASTLTGALTANGGVGTTTLSTSGLATLNSASVTGNLSVGGTLTLTGGLTLNGNVTVGDSSADTLTINSTITSHLLFTDNTYDIGASGATRPRNLYLAGDGVIGGTLGVSGVLTASGGVTGNLTGNVTGNVTGNISGGTVAGTTGTFSSNVTVGGTLGVTGATTLSSTLGVTGAITASGGVSGNVTGNLTGNVTGSISGGTVAGSTGAFSSNVTVGGTLGVTGVATLTANPVLSAGTANGVLYLNGSKVATSGSGLTYNGSTLATTGALTVDGNATLGNASTDTVTVNGYVGVRATPQAYYGISLGNASTITGDASPRGISSSAVYGSDATGTVSALFGQVRSTAASYTMANAIGVRLGDVSKGAGSTITNQHGVYIDDQTSGTNNYGITSLVSSGTNKWNIYASGTANNYFAGSVGIGTSSPATDLHIKNATDTQLLIESGTSSTGFVLFGDADDLNVGSVSYNHSDNSMRFETSDSERMRITSAGNVGIGTSSPTARLQIEADSGGNNFKAARGAGSLLESFQSTTGINYLYTSGASAALVFGTGTSVGSASERMRITSAGDVGIGTSSPAAKLDIGGNTAATLQAIFGRGVTDSNFTVRYTNGASGTQAFIGSLGLDYANGTWADMATIKFYRNSTAGELAFFASAAAASGTEQMRLTTTGLGIGTSSPSGFLANKLVIATGGTANEGMTIYSSSNNGSIWFADATTGTGRYAGGFDYSHSDDTLIFYSAAQGNMRLTASGNLGLGVTPSAWRNLINASQVGGTGAAIWSYTSGIGNQYCIVSNNSFEDSSGNEIYIRTNPAAKYEQFNSQHRWYSAASGTAGGTISFTQAMTLDASGNLLVGATSAAGTERLNVVGGTGIRVNEDGSGTKVISIRSDFAGVGPAINVTTNDPLLFQTNNTERARITSGGAFLVGTTNDSPSAGEGAKIYPAGTMRCVNADTTNSTENWSMYSTGAANYRFYVGWGGTVYATNATISAISDQRFKENIQDLDVGLDAIIALKPRKFDWKEGKGKDIKGDRGFIAQEFEQVFPDLIDEWRDPAPEGEEPYKSVRQDLIPVLVKAIQELKAELDATKAEVAALKGAN